MKPWYDGLSLLLVDDDDRLSTRLAEALVARGLVVQTAQTASEALDADRPALDLAVIDLRIGEDSGLDVIRTLIERHESLRTVLLTGYGSIPATVEAMRLGAINVVQKPADPDEILAAFVERGLTDLAHHPPSLDRVEWEHIQRVLADCDGNISQAARKLGLHRRTLQRKLQRRPSRT